MSWVFFVLIGAVFNSLKNTLTRRIGGTIDVYTVALVSNLLMLPVLWLGALLFNEATIDPTFWKLLLVMLPFEILVMLLFFKALTSSRLSYSFPFVSFMPVFVALGAFFILGEVVHPMMYLGAGVVVTGAFLMNINQNTPRADLRGVMYMLMVAALWGYLAPMGKLAVTYASPQLYPAVYFTLATLLFLPIFYFKHTTPLKEVAKRGGIFVVIGISFALFTMSNWYAYAQGPATGVAALVQLAVPLTALMGIFMHKEGFSWRRLAGIVIMTIGAITVVLHR